MHRCTIAFASLSRLSRCIIAVLLVASTLALIPLPVVRAATITANVFTDPVPGTCATTGMGNCSLRETVIYANAHPDTSIMLLPGTYALTIGHTSDYDPVTDSSRGSLMFTNTNGTTTLIGAGANATIIDASGMAPVRDRVFTVGYFDEPAGIRVNISGVTIRGGQTTEGAGIYIDLREQLSLANAIITANHAQTGSGMLNYGITQVTHTQIINNSGIGLGTDTLSYAGGIMNEGSDEELTITDSEISGNHTTAAGGIESVGLNPLIMINSTIANNVADVDGGGLFLERFATLTDCIIQGNHASRAGGGIDNYGGNLTLIRSTVRANTAGMTYSSGNPNAGGGIDNLGALTMTDSTIMDNRAYLGGGLYNIAEANDQAVVSGSTLSGNAATLGGGIYNDSVIVITNSTISGNTADGTDADIVGVLMGTAGGAIYSLISSDPSSEQVTLINDTFAANNTGVMNNITYTKGNPWMSAMIVKNSLFANTNTNCAGAFVLTGDYNLSSDTTCSRGLTDAHDINQQDPHLGPLANNGGRTETHALLLGSPAIDAGGTGCLAVDQRGITRPQGEACDIGAFEVANEPPQPQLHAPSSTVTTGQPVPAPQPHPSSSTAGQTGSQPQPRTSPATAANNPGVIPTYVSSPSMPTPNPQPGRH